MDNKSNNKKIAKNTFVLFVRMCVIAILGLVSSRYMLRYLGEVDFGIYNVVGGAVNLMAFFNIVLASATNRFLMVELGKGANGDVGRVFTTSLQIHAAIGLLVILLGETIGLWYAHTWLNVPANRSADVLIIYQISLFTCALCVLQVPYQGLLITYENFTGFSMAQMAMMIGIFVASISIGGIDNHRLIWFSVFMAISQLFGLLLYFIIGKKYAPPMYRNIDKKQLRSMLNFSGWIALGAASSMGKSQGSNVVLNYYFGPIVNSAFSIGNQVNTQLNRLTENVSKSFNPQIMMTYEQGQRERMTNLVCASSKYSFFLLYLVAFPFFIKADYILKLWLGEYPKDTVIFCHILMISILLNALMQGVHPAVQATGKIKWFQIVGSTISLSSIPLAIISFHWGAPPYLLSIAFLGTAIINMFVSYYMLFSILQFPIMQFLKGLYLKVLPVIASTLPLLWLFDECFANSIWQLVELVFISSVLIVLTIWLFGLTRSERNTVINFLKKHIK